MLLMFQNVFELEFLNISENDYYTANFNKVNERINQYVMEWVGTIIKSLFKFCS